MQRLATQALCCATAAAVLWAGPAHARKGALIGTEQVAGAQSQALLPSPERARLLAALERADVANALAARGVTVEDAQLRVRALTDAEVRSLLRHMDSAPAGAYWLTPFFLASMTVSLMYLVNRLDVIDRIREAWSMMESEARRRRQGE